MRSVQRTEEGSRPDERRLAQIAADHTSASVDSYSGYGVGVAAEVIFETPYGDDTHIYGGSNINISGMEYKLHAEQSAMFDMMRDALMYDLKEYASIGRVVVHTSENDHSLVCGHCLQVVAGVCEWLGQDPSTVDYWSVKAQGLKDNRGNFDAVHYDFNRNKLTDLIETTYVSNRDDN